MAKNAVDDRHIANDILLNVIADVILNGIIAVDAFADFLEDFVPGPADLRIEVTSKRAEVFVECFRGPAVGPFNAFANRRAAVSFDHSSILLFVTLRRLAVPLL